MALYNVESEEIDVHIQRQMRVSPEALYRAWTDVTYMKQWFMTSTHTNVAIEVDAQLQGKYRVVDQRKDKQFVVEGIYEALTAPQHVKMTMGVPDNAASIDHIDVAMHAVTEELTQMDFVYKATFPRTRGMTNLSYKQAKKTYHDTLVHGFEHMFDTLQRTLEAHV